MLELNPRLCARKLNSRSSQLVIAFRVTLKYAMINKNGATLVKLGKFSQNKNSSSQQKLIKIVISLIVICDCISDKTKMCLGKSHNIMALGLGNLHHSFQAKPSLCVCVCFFKAHALMRENNLHP